MEIFPAQHRQKHYGRVTLGNHYQHTLKQLGFDANELPVSLYYTFVGDLLGASGEHYAKGSLRDFDEICRTSGLNFSDDFMESLAMHLMRNMPLSTDLPSLFKKRDLFLALIRTHFEKMAQTYSPWFGALFSAETPEDYLNIILNHSSCGAAMRAAAIADDGLDNEKALPLFLITHANTQAVEGGYFILGYARAAKNGASFEAALAEAARTAEWGRNVIQNFQKEYGSTVQKGQTIIESVQAVLKSGNPYINIDDIADDGIETHFVVSSVMLVLKNTDKKAPGLKAFQEMIIESLRIGGDPDTICSIASSLYGLLHHATIKAEVDALWIGQN